MILSHHSWASENAKVCSSAKLNVLVICRNLLLESIQPKKSNYKRCLEEQVLKLSLRYIRVVVSKDQWHMGKKNA